MPIRPKEFLVLNAAVAKSREAPVAGTKEAPALSRAETAFMVVSAKSSKLEKSIFETLRPLAAFKVYALNAAPRPLTPSPASRLATAALEKELLIGAILSAKRLPCVAASLTAF